MTNNKAFGGAHTYVGLGGLKKRTLQNQDRSCVDSLIYFT
jgi:hypothetical protein